MGDQGCYNMLFKWGGVCRFCSVDVEDPVDDCGFLRCWLLVLLSQKKVVAVEECEGGAPSEKVDHWVVYLPLALLGLLLLGIILGLGIWPCAWNFCSLER